MSPKKEKFKILTSKKILNAPRFSLETERHISINKILMKKMKFRIPFRSDCHLILLACKLSVAKCHGSWVVGRGHGWWVWVWILIRFVYFYISGFVACDRNYHWRQWKMQLWRWLLNFRVCVFLKSAVKDSKTLWEDSTFSCHKNFTLCGEQSLLLSLGTLSKSLWQPLLRRRWMRSPRESMSPQPTTFQL